MKYSQTSSVVVLAIAGFLFSGYLSGVKFFTATCALGETCPLFLGQPACYFGFGLFTLVLLSALMMLAYNYARMGRVGVLLFSFLGILFAGYFTVLELPLLFAQGLGAYLLGLPTCALGLLVFVGVFFLALFSRRVPMFEEFE